MSEICYLGLGSNLGDRKYNLARAIRLLHSYGFKILKKSGIYETEPMYYKKQNNFFNMAIKTKTNHNAFEILEIIKKIENKLGRKKTIKKGPRVIDIDLLFWGDKIINTENLVVPHPGIIKRGFVIKPMLELDKEFIHPVEKKSMALIAKDLGLS